MVARIDPLLRGDNGSERNRRIRDILMILVIAGSWYGAVMGTYSGIGPAHWRQIFYSAVKVPLLLSATFYLSLRPDFSRALGAVIGAQAVLTIILASLSLFAEFFYVSGCNYEDAILLNAAMFGIASFGGQFALWRSYRPLIAKNTRHRWTLKAWLTIYIFVGIQMGWTLRPFVGSPGMPTRFIRSEAISNGYISIVHIIWDAI